MSGAGQMAVVAAGIGRGQRKLISRVPTEYLKQILAERVYIFNISETTFGPISRTHSNLTIEGRGEAQYSVLAIGGRVEYADAGIEESVNEQVTSAKEIADDLTNWCNGDLPRCVVAKHIKPFVGVWWELTPTPTLLAEKTEELKAYYKALVAQANAFAETTAGAVNIGDLMRTAARALGLQPKWLFLVTDEMRPCPACGTPIIPNIAVCPTCRAIVDETKARKFFPERFTGAAVAGPVAASAPEPSIDEFSPEAEG
jgi:hypothetical protein